MKVTTNHTPTVKQACVLWRHTCRFTSPGYPRSRFKILWHSKVCSTRGGVDAFWRNTERFIPLFLYLFRQTDTIDKATTPRWSTMTRQMQQIMATQRRTHHKKDEPFRHESVETDPLDELWHHYILRNNPGADNKPTQTRLCATPLMFLQQTVLFTG